MFFDILNGSIIIYYQFTLARLVPWVMVRSMCKNELYFYDDMKSRNLYFLATWGVKDSILTHLVTTFFTTTAPPTPPTASPTPAAPPIIFTIVLLLYSNLCICKSRNIL